MITAFQTQKRQEDFQNRVKVSRIQVPPICTTTAQAGNSLCALIS